MKSAARKAVLVLVSCLAAATIAVLLWLPWNPFEADAGPLDAWVPADADALIRLDAKGVREGPAFRKLWDGPAGRTLRADFDLDARLDAVKRLDAALAALPFAGDDPPTVERDFLGGETLVALRGDDVLAMTRISSRAKAIDLLRRAGDARRAQWGIRIDGDAYVVDLGDGRSAWFARRRDALLVATSREWLDASLALASGGGASIVEDADYRATRPAAPSGERLRVWAAGRFLERRVVAANFVRTMLRPAFAHGVAADVDLTNASSIRANVRVAGAAGDLVDVANLARLAGALARRDEAFAIGALPISPNDAVAALIDSQPESRRKLVESLLAESHSSVADVTSDLARHFAPGVGFVVARLAETSALRLDDADGDPVEPIPATVVVFQLADADAEPFLADLRRHAATLFGADARLTESSGPGPTRWITAPDASFGREWAMLRPAVRIEGRTVVFTTNEAYLRRAKGEDVRWFRDAPPSVAVVGVDVANLRKRLDDLRWEHADRATYRDWAAERRAIREQMGRLRNPPSPEEAERREDDEIARRIEDRKRRLFPKAVRDYRESLRWLDAFVVAELVAVNDGGAVRLDATIEWTDR